MVSKRTVEITVGLFVAAGLAALLMLAMKVSNMTAFTEQGGYTLTAEFGNIGGLKVRSPVTMAGVRIGRVTDIGFDKQTFEAVVSISIASQYNNLPTDTSASILTSGVLGENYVGLEPGGAETVLKNGDKITITQSAVVLENLISQFLFKSTEKKE